VFTEQSGEALCVYCTVCSVTASPDSAEHKNIYAAMTPTTSISTTIWNFYCVFTEQSGEALCVYCTVCRVTASPDSAEHKNIYAAMTPTTSISTTL